MNIMAGLSEVMAEFGVCQRVTAVTGVVSKFYEMAEAQRSAQDAPAGPRGTCARRQPMDGAIGVLARELDAVRV